MLIRTKSFDLAITKSGSDSAKRLAILLPGRLDTKDYAHLVFHRESLAKQGFLAISFDPPGTWDSPGDISLYTVTNYVRAINELISFFGDRHTVLIGHSLGGVVATIVAAQNEHVLCVARLMSPLEFSTKYSTPKSHVSNRDLPSGGMRSFTLPASFFVDAATYDIQALLNSLKKPVLFVCGKKDETIPWENVQQTFNNHGGAKELFMADMGHSYRRDTSAILLIDEVIHKFLKENI